MLPQPYRIRRIRTGSVLGYVLGTRAVTSHQLLSASVSQVRDDMRRRRTPGMARLLPTCFSSHLGLLGEVVAVHWHAARLFGSAYRAVSNPSSRLKEPAGPPPADGLLTCKTDSWTGNLSAHHTLVAPRRQTVVPSPGRVILRRNPLTSQPQSVRLLLDGSTMTSRGR
jgi:hypothetical protein